MDQSGRLFRQRTCRARIRVAKSLDSLSRVTFFQRYRRLSDHGVDLQSAALARNSFFKARIFVSRAPAYFSPGSADEFRRNSAVFVARLGGFDASQPVSVEVRLASPASRDQFRIVEFFDKLLP